jgi:hypothetical protein
MLSGWATSFGVPKHATTSGSVASKRSSPGLSCAITARVHSAPRPATANGSQLATAMFIPNTAVFMGRLRCCPTALYSQSAAAHTVTLLLRSLGLQKCHNRPSHSPPVFRRHTTQYSGGRQRLAAELVQRQTPRLIKSRRGGDYSRKPLNSPTRCDDKICHTPQRQAVKVV